MPCEFAPLELALLVPESVIGPAAFITPVLEIEIPRELPLLVPVAAPVRFSEPVAALIVPPVIEIPMPAPAVDALVAKILIASAVTEALLAQPVIPEPVPVVIPWVAMRLPGLMVSGCVTEIALPLAPFAVIVAKVTVLLAVNVPAIRTPIELPPVPLVQVLNTTGPAVENVFSD